MWAVILRVWTHVMCTVYEVTMVLKANRNNRIRNVKGKNILSDRTVPICHWEIFVEPAYWSDVAKG